MPWRKYLLITLTRNHQYLNFLQVQFPSPASSIFCLLFPFVPSPTRGSQQFVLFEGRGQLRVTIMSPACHEGRGQAGTSGHLPCHTFKLVKRTGTTSFPRILERNYLLWRSRNQSEETPTVCSPASFIMGRGARVYITY